jgi:SNF2 family DNA or RNA helicase
MTTAETAKRPRPLQTDLTIAPGTRVRIRGEEWIVRLYEPSADGGYLVKCTGVSDLVRGYEAQFLEKIEGKIEVLDPATTRLVDDHSSKYSAALLYIEALRLRSTPNDARIRLAHQSVLDVMDFQFEPARLALKQPRPRILIADAVGLGKTMEAGILATELIQRGRGKRILVVTLKSMLTQFQKEWWSRFTIPLVRLDSVGLARVRDRIPANHNPFNYYDKTIISMDTLKDNLEYRNYLDKAYWDIIVIDECHNVAQRKHDTGSSLRAKLATRLASRSDALILLSATPHDGSPTSFASLISLLDPTVIPDPEHYKSEDFRDKGLVVRRFKHDVRSQVAQTFKDRITERIDATASIAEESAYAALVNLPFTNGGEAKGGKQHELQRIGTQKALFSSPAAAIRSARERIKRLSSAKSTSDESIERSAQERYVNILENIHTADFSKYQRLLRTLNDPKYAWDRRSSTDRLVIFSERIETLEWLRISLSEDLNMRADQLAVLHGGLNDQDQQDLVDRFGRADDHLRILLCSDVASEGINLHYFCHRLVHFDMPWSLMTYSQRNGRIDQLGQTDQPIILYFQTITMNDSIRGDQRVLEVLLKKEEQAYQNLGDPSSFLNKYDVEDEEGEVATLMLKKLNAAALEETLDNNYQHSAETTVRLRHGRR